MVTNATVQRTMRQKKMTTWRNSWPELSIIHSSIWWPNTIASEARPKGSSAMGTSMRARAASPKGPVFRRQMIGAAETFHQRKHDAEAGEETEAGCGEDELIGAEVMGEN